MVPSEQVGSPLSSGRGGSLPLVVGWSFTKKCNLHCLHCYSNSGKALPRELGLEEALQIADKLAEAKVWAVNFGGGECALRPDFLDLCYYLREKGIEISYTTNGTVLDRLKKHLHLFHDVGVSLDFSTEEKHDLFRGRKGTFNKAVRTIEYLVSHGANTEIVTCLNKLNCSEKELVSLYRLAQDLKVNYWRLNRFKENGRGYENKQALALAPEELKKAYGLLANHSKEIHSPDPLFRAAYGGTYFIRGDPSGQTAFRIQADGKVTPCVFLSESGGNLLHRPLEEILDSEIFRKIRNRIPFGKCRTCNAYAHCGGGDAGASYAAYGHFNGPDPLCWQTPEEKKPSPQKSSTQQCNVHEMYLCTVYLPIRGEKQERDRGER